MIVKRTGDCDITLIAATHWRIILIDDKRTMSDSLKTSGITLKRIVLTISTLLTVAVGAMCAFLLFVLIFRGECPKLPNGERNHGCGEGAAYGLLFMIITTPVFIGFVLSTIAVWKDWIRPSTWFIVLFLFLSVLIYLNF